MFSLSVSLLCCVVDMVVVLVSFQRATALAAKRALCECCAFLNVRAEKRTGEPV